MSQGEMRFNKTEVGQILEDVKQGMIVQQVNAQGVMGGGIALAIREKWPLVWDTYSSVIKQRTPDKGASYMGMVIYVQAARGLYIANIVSQQFFGRDGKRYTSYDALDIGLNKVRDFAERNNIDHIHYPLIGCGLGGGDWSIVSAIIDKNLDTMNHTFWKQP